MNLCEPLILQVPKGIGFVPSTREKVEWGASSDGGNKVVRRESLLESAYHMNPYSVFLRGHAWAQAAKQLKEAIYLVVLLKYFLLCRPEKT